MTEANSQETTEHDGLCSWCDGAWRGTQYVQLVKSSTLVFCSEDCMRAQRRDDALARSAARRRTVRVFVVGTALVGAFITPHEGPPSRRARAAAPVLGTAQADAGALPGAFGPEWPPNEASLIAELGRDAWLHPMPGPFRRMPMRDSRVFGAERAGDRPIECRRGHCGVDVGGEIWGEHVHAAHDGIIDRVQRAPNEQHGGHYVRIAHRNGTVFTQYFHLAAIPRRLQPGVQVKAGELIGALGDTGVTESSAHLHFTVSVKPGKNWPEQYMDPEPLIALWPLRIPLERSPIALLSTAGKVGVPLGTPIGAARKGEVAKRQQTTKAARRHASSPAATSEKGRAAPSRAPSKEEESASESSPE
jgi:murein DD-endopeptidase MepM/ murein hydrolase activator NlpD